MTTAATDPSTRLGATLRRGRIAAAAAACLWGLLPAAQAGTLDRLDFNPGNLSAELYLPETPRRWPPLVVALHGCGQRAADFDDESGWRGLADELGFILLLPEQSAENNASLCFNWMLPSDRVRGGGEARSIRQLIDVVMQRHGVDPGQVYVTGLSAGGAMATVMLATYPELFAGGAVVAGLPYLCVAHDDPVTASLSAPVCVLYGNQTVVEARQWGDRVRGASPHRGPSWPRLSIWHGTADRIVNPINVQDLMEQWTDLHGIDQQADRDAFIDGHSHRIYRGEDATALVEVYEISGMGHGMPVDPAQGCGIDRAEGDALAPDSNDYMIDAGICASRRIAKFWGLMP